jgi:hypothetical protein
MVDLGWSRLSKALSFDQRRFVNLARSIARHSLESKRTLLS